jgi:predicted amidohydrolase YtcJ
LKADLLLTGGPVVSLDDTVGTARAVAIKGNHILAVGSENDLAQCCGPHTRTIHLAGRSVLPGFIDAHSHFLTAGMKQMAVDCTYGPVRTIDDVLERLKKKAAATPLGKWVRAVRYSDFRIQEQRFPTRDEIDAVVPDHPVLITRTCGHTSAVNSLALNMAEIGPDTPDPVGGIIVREDGRPSGVLKETAQDSIRLLARPDEDELALAIDLAGKYYLQNGVTSTHDMGGRFREEITALVKARRDDRLKVRIYFSIVQGKASYLHGNLFRDSGLTTGFGDAFLRVGPLKLFLDGAEDSGTAAMTRPYRDDPDNVGVTYLDSSELEALTWPAHERGFQISIHAIGDLAVEMAVDAIAAALNKAPRPNHRHRIEHAVFLNESTIRRMSRLGILAVLQPIFLASITKPYLDKIGRDRLDEAYFIKRFLVSGVKIAGSSDCPVEPVQPLAGVKAAMLRRCETGEVLLPDERVDRLTALKMFGPWAAYASFEEHLKGTIAPGKLADLVVLDGDVLTISPEEMDRLKISLTISDGQIVYAS